MKKTFRAYFRHQLLGAALCCLSTLFVPLDIQGEQKSNITDKTPSIDVLLLGYYVWAKPEYIELCKKEGINIYGPMRQDPMGADPEDYPLEFLKKFDVVVASGPLERPWDPQMVRGEIKSGIVDNLLEFNRQGGGIMWIPLGAGYGANSWTDSIGKRIDAVALDESLDDPAKEVSVSLMQSFRNTMRYIWTTDVSDHPVTKDVRGLLFGLRGEWGWPGTIPMKFGDSWKTLVRGMDSTRTTKNASPEGGKERKHTRSKEIGTYQSHPELIAVKPESSACKGRMLIQPIYTTWTWGNHGHPAMKDAFLFNGDGVHPSDGQRFLINAWKWLAGPAEKAGDFGGYKPPAEKKRKNVDLSPVIWNPINVTELRNDPEKRGVFGVMSGAGGGKGTVKEWADAAREAGLDFVVFTDDPNKHTEKSYQTLVEECAKNSDDKLTLVPGWGAEDVYGVYRFFPGMKKLPQKNRLDKDGRVKSPAGIACDTGWRIGQVVADMSKLPYNPWWEHVIMACAPITYDGTKLVDDSVDSWLRNCEANSMNLLPMSLTKVSSPNELGEVARKAHTTILKTDKTDNIAQFARKGAGGQVLPSYLTNGPRIPIWRTNSTQGEPFRPNSSRYRILLKATSDVGLAKVEIINATDGSVYRMWEPNGQKEFSTTIDENTADQLVLGLIVTDINGNTAIAPPIYRFQGANRVWFMGDRLMGLHHYTNWDEKRENLVTHGTPTGVNYVKGHPDGGGEFKTDHSAKLKFQGLEGAGIYPPAFKIIPQIETNLGREPDHGRLAMRYNLKLAGHDLSVFDFVSDHQYKKGEKFVFDGLPALREETEQATIVSRSWTPRQLYMAPVTTQIHEISVIFKKDVELKKMFLGHYHGPDAPGEFNLLIIKPKTDATPLTWQFDEHEKFTKQTAYSKGGYLYQAKALAGTMGFIALDDKVESRSAARAHQFFLSKKYLGHHEKGDKITVRMLRISHAYDNQQGSNEWLEKFMKDYGIGVEPAYSYSITQGTVKEINYVMDLNANEGGSCVTIKKYNLPELVPVRVNGVGEQAVLGEYDVKTKRLRPLPYFEGTVTTTIETRLKDTTLYVGEWLIWDNEKVRVSLVTDGMDFLLEAHNPTDQEITCAFKGASGFAPLASYAESLTIPPHISIKKTIKSTPNTVALVPIR